MSELQTAPVSFDAWTNELGPDHPQLEPVRLGEVVTLRCLDSSGDQIREGTQRQDIDTSRLFPVVGPVGIDDVAAGDTIGIEVVSLRHQRFGHTWTRPGLGIRSVEDLHVLQIDTAEEVISGRSALARLGIEVRLRPHIGALGVLPAETLPARTLGAHGGNLDFVRIEPGATLWLTAQVAGAGVFAGDVHATIGDGEICGTGAETGAEVALAVHRDNSWRPGLPTVEARDGTAWVIAIADTVEDALAVGSDYCASRLSEAFGLTAEEAYLITGLLLRVELCQVVNPRVSVAVSLGSGMSGVLKGPVKRTGRVEGAE